MQDQRFPPSMVVASRCALSAPQFPCRVDQFLRVIKGVDPMSLATARQSVDRRVRSPASGRPLNESCFSRALGRIASELDLARRSRVVIATRETAEMPLLAPPLPSPARFYVRIWVDRGNRFVNLIP